MICELNTETGEITISGSGDFNKNFCEDHLIKTVIIKNGITSIGNWVFEECSSLTSITIPDSVTSIGDGVFFGCSSLTSITIPDSVTSIGSSAFDGCSSLTSITVDSKNLDYSSMDGVLFNKDSTVLIKYPSGNTQKTYTIPNSVTSIKGDAFYGCSFLTSITIPVSITKIEGYTFYGCSSLTSITIPDSVTSIGKKAFGNCTSLTSISIPDTVTSIESYAFKNCISLNSIRIPKTITSIGNGAFEYCNSLTSITIPDSVTSIGDSAFEDCSSLTSITIPDSVTKIGSSAFSGCSSLTSIRIPNNVISIGDRAFKDCSSLTSITIPDSISITKIENYTFYGCSSLTSIIIPGSVIEIKYNAFSGCSSLTSITIPDSVTSIESGVFSGCSSLTSIIVDSKNLDYSSMDGVLFNKYSTVLIKYPSGNTQETYIIPNIVTSIESGAFENCSSLTSITIPDSVTSIGSSAFDGCSSLTSITVDSENLNYSSMDGVLFNKYSTVLIKYPSGNTQKTYTIPNTVTEIGSSAFEGCSSLKNVIFNGKKEPYCGDSIFSNTEIKKIKVYIDYTGYSFCAYDIERVKSVEPGYYINNADSNSYIKCTNIGCETLQIPTESKSCTSDNDGKLIYDGFGVVLCTKMNKLITKDNGSYEIAKDHYTVIPFATTETNYLVHHAINGEVFNFDRTPSNVYYVVKSNENSIVFNPEFNKKDHCADNDGKLIDRVTDFCSGNSSGMYYTCVNGKCTSEYQTIKGEFEDNGEKGKNIYLNIM